MRSLSIRGLRKHYPRSQDFWRLLRRPGVRERVVALDGVDAEFEAGRVYGLIGANGAGKTSLLKILGGLVLADEGQVLLDGRDCARAPERLREIVGMVVADERSFYWRLSVRENLRFFATLQGLSGKERARQVERVLAAVELEDRATDPFRSLSTGLRQRLAIARGLLGDPRVLLMDEATRSLDPQSAAHVRELLGRLFAADRERTLVYSTHDLQEVEELCTDVIVLRSGKRAFSASLAQMRAARRWRIVTREPLGPLGDLEGVRRRGDGRNPRRVEVETSAAEGFDRFLQQVLESGAGLVSVEPLTLDAAELYGIPVDDGGAAGGGA
jgi:ABC-2 type transport system ATP-binding protein